MKVMSLFSLKKGLGGLRLSRNACLYDSLRLQKQFWLKRAERGKVRRDNYRRRNYWARFSEVTDEQAARFENFDL